MVCHILTYLPARDLKTIRLVNHFLAQVARKNIFWSELCRIKWSEKLCLETIPVPTPHVPERTDKHDDCEVMDIDDEEEIQPMGLVAYLSSMENPEEHTYDELVPKSLYELAYFFPAFNIIEGTWLRAYNLIDQHMEIPYLHSTVRCNHFSVSDTQWELYLFLLFMAN